MRHAGKRIVSSLCALALLAAMLPAQAMATGTTEPGASVQQELSETSDGETKTDTDAGNVSGQEGGENQNDLNGSEGRDDQTPNEEEKESTAEGGETDLSEDEKDEKTDGADLSGDDTTEADGSREPADGENDSGSQNGQNGGAEQGNLPPSNDGAETLEEPVGGETENGNGETETDPQAEGDVARIGNKTYTTLDEAVKDAADGATIELLADAETSGLNLSKNLTIKAADGSSQRPTITFTQYGIALWGKALTFKDCNVVMEGIGSTPYTGEWHWMTISASTDASLTLDHVEMTMDATGTTNSPHAIYFCNNNELNLKNGTTLTIKNYANDALEWDGGNGGYNVNITDSTFVSDHNRSGFTGTFYATIKNSDVDVINSTGNGSNGSHFIIEDSTVDFNNNGSHGLSAGALYIKNSTVNAKDNGGMGITVNNELSITNNSVVTVTGNDKKTDANYAYAAMRLYNDYEFLVDESSKLYINNNYNTGLYVRQGKLTVEDGAVLEIMGNHVENNLLNGYGGGVYVGYGDNYDPEVILPADAKIYNNHAKVAGDDIYVSEGVNGPTLTFGNVGSNWNLDDCKNDEGNTVEGCTTGGVIDGWYDDSENEVGEDGAVTSYNRWNAHDGDGIYHVEKYSTFTDGVTTVSGTLSLKAAHGASATLQPADITIYMGGEDGYDGVLGNGEAQSSNSLPTPGFYFTLPADLNQVLSNALGKDPTTAIDLSGLVTVTATGDDGKARTWKLERYGVEGGSSTAIVDEASGLERFIYKIVPMETGQAPVRVQFTDKETGWTATSDNFTPDTALHNEYTMELYTGGVNPNSITMEFTLPEEKGTYTCGYDQENSKSGTLTVRYANNDALIIDAVEDMDAAIANEDEMFYVEADSDQPFFINEQDTAGTGEDTHKTGVEVDFTDVSLLADDIITQERADALYDRAEQAAESAGLENVNMFAKYFDLVDKENGNAWLTPADGETVTVYWPYPAGTDKNTEFKLYHFEGLDREMQVEDVEQEVYDAEMEDMKITKGETGITFETGSFSPFVLAWENPAEQPSGGSGSEENPAPTATPQPTPAPAEAEPVAAPAPAAATVPQTGDEMPVALLGVSAAGAAVVFVALLAVRKRRHGQD